MPFFYPPLGGKIRLNYQDPDIGVFYSLDYGVRGIYIYIYIAIISDVNEKAV